MALEYPDFLQAMGAVNADGTVVSQNGGQVTRSGVGIYDLNLDAPLPQDLGVIVVTPRTAFVDNANNWTVVHVTDTHYQVQFSNGAGGDADRAFSWVALKQPQQA